jgi:DNA-binding transcriptional regulator LsrR (DeoR family)
MPENRELMLRATWAHLIGGRTQESVAQSLGLTRARVNRLIAECREAGLIHFVIAHDARVSLREENSLKDVFGIADAWVVPEIDVDGSKAQLQAVGAAAGAYVSKVLGNGQTLAIGWGRTLDASVAGLQPRSGGGNQVVTLFGSMVRGRGLSSFDIASRYARTLDAECCYLMAPLVTETPEEAENLRKSAHIREAMEIAASADVVLVGIDDLSSESTLHSTGQLSTHDLKALRDAGAICILQSEAIGRDGKAISHPFATRIVGLDSKRFTQIPTRIIVAAGKRKAASLKAALRGGYCNTVITDEPTARELLLPD